MKSCQDQSVLSADNSVLSLQGRSHSGFRGLTGSSRVSNSHSSSRTRAPSRALKGTATSQRRPATYFPPRRTGPFPPHQDRPGQGCGACRVSEELRASVASASTEALGAGCHHPANTALLELVIVLVEILLLRTLQVVLADEHPSAPPEGRSLT